MKIFTNTFKLFFVYDYFCMVTPEASASGERDGP